MLIGKDFGFAGGAELQQVILAKELVKRKFDVTFIVRDFGQPRFTSSNGIKIVNFHVESNREESNPTSVAGTNSIPKDTPRTDSIPKKDPRYVVFSMNFNPLIDSAYKGIDLLYTIKNFFGAFFGKYFSIIKNFYKYWKIVREIDADIYCQRCAGFQTGILALVCKIQRKKFVYSVAHKMDVDGTLIDDSYLKNTMCITKKIYRNSFKFGLKTANLVIVQNTEQQQLLLKNYRKKSLLIKSLFEATEKHPKKPDDLTVLWVGSIQRWKQPELFIQLAEKIPSAKFLLIGGPSVDKEYFEYITIRAKSLENMEYLGFIPYPQINDYFHNAAIFVNTSVAEGFPNTFLQSWARSVPVVSLNVDPDEAICINKLGFHSKNWEQLVHDVMSLIQNDSVRNEMGKNGWKYINTEHNVDKIVDEYIIAFNAVFEGKLGLLLE
jgi:glycosyltransferase involved in cell wall biosynthesis